MSPRIWAVPFVGLVMFVVQAPSALAAEDVPAPKLVISGPEVHDVLLMSVSDPPPGTAAGALLSRGQIHLVVTNEGTLAATPTITAYLDGDEGACAPGETTLDNAVSQTWEPGETRQLSATLLVDASCPGTTGTLIIDAQVPGASTSKARFRFGEEFSSAIYWTPFLGGLAIAACFNVILLSLRREWTRTIGTGTAWSFKDSWLTNVAAIGAVLGSVLAATGFLEDVLPGASTARVLGLNLLFGGMVLGAPVIFALASKWSYLAAKPGEAQILVSQGTVLGVVLAAGATIWGTLGQLLTLMLLAGQAETDPASRNAARVVLAVGVVLVIFYAVRFTLGVTKEPPPTPSVPGTHVSGSL